MPAVRPLSALRPTLFAMADEAQRANILAVKAATERVKDDVARRGRRYTLRGRGGKQVPLGARADVKGPVERTHAHEARNEQCEQKGERGDMPDDEHK